MCNNKEIHSHGEHHEHTDGHDLEHSHDHGEEHVHEHEHQHAHAHPHTHDHGQPSAGDIENKDIEILGILLDHWVTHNQDHAMEYNTWVEKMNRLGKNEVAEDIIEAMALIVEADKHLAAAKKTLLS